MRQAGHKPAELFPFRTDQEQSENSTRQQIDATAVIILPARCDHTNSSHREAARFQPSLLLSGHGTTCAASPTRNSRPYCIGSTT